MKTTANANPFSMQGSTGLPSSTNDQARPISCPQALSIPLSRKQMADSIPAQWIESLFSVGSLITTLPQAEHDATLFPTSGTVPDFRLLHIILKHSHLAGARALHFLLLHPDCSYSGQAVWQALHGLFCGNEPIPQNPDSIAAGALFESNIALTDTTSIKEVRQELSKLRKLRAFRQEGGFNTSTLDAQITALSRYLSECLRPDGNIRIFPSVSQKANQSLTQALKRFISRIPSTDPLLTTYVQNHLLMDDVFLWRSDAVQ